MFANVKNIYALLIGNSMDSCKEDVKLLKGLFKKHNCIIKSVFDGYPDVELINFIKIYSDKITKDDLFYFHYSGHGVLRGVIINGKLEMISGWSNPDLSITSSLIIDKILSGLYCNILLTSDSCSSGGFGDHYTGRSPYVFLGSSTFIESSTEYKIKKEKTGIIACIIQYIFINKNIKTVSRFDFSEAIKHFYTRYRIINKPVIKFKNIDE